MGEEARLFVAVSPPEDVARELERLVASLRPLAGRARLRWCRREQLHVTLRFIGEVPLADAPKIAGAVASVTVEPFDVALDRAGAFPSMARPRVLWLSGERGAEELSSLAARVDEALLRVGIPPRDRPFVPHLTLARCDGGLLPPTLLRALLRALEEIPPLAWRCEGCALVRSSLGPGGPRYERLWPGI